MTVPETAMYEDRPAATAVGEVRRPRQVSVGKRVPPAENPHQAPDFQFDVCPLLSNEAHPLRRRRVHLQPCPFGSAFLEKRPRDAIAAGFLGTCHGKNVARKTTSLGMPLMLSIGLKGSDLRYNARGNSSRSCIPSLLVCDLCTGGSRSPQRTVRRGRFDVERPAGDTSLTAGAMPTRPSS
jgi:hypothetical protein